LKKVENTPEEIKALQDKLDALESENAGLKSKAAKSEEKAAKAEADVRSIQRAAKAEAKKNAPVSFEVEDDEEKGIEGGEYEFTAPTLTWDDNQVYNIRKLSESKDDKENELFAEMCAKLVQRKSGLVARKED
jgi:hypothetical protein